MNENNSAPPLDTFSSQAAHMVEMAIGNVNKSRHLNLKVRPVDRNPMTSRASDGWITPWVRADFVVSTDRKWSLAKRVFGERKDVAEIQVLASARNGSDEEGSVSVDIVSARRDRLIGHVSNVRTKTFPAAPETVAPQLSSELSNLIWKRTLKVATP